MATRRARKGRLRQKDEFPNYITGNITIPVGNISGIRFISETIFTPLPRLRTQGNKATVMEFLWVEVFPVGASLTEPTDELLFGLSVGLNPTTFQLISNPQVVMNAGWRFMGVEGANAERIMWRHNFQDEQGHGFLVASDTFNAYAQRVTFDGEVALPFRIYYRFVDISVFEYIGIVQSSTQTGSFIRGADINA